MAKNLKLIRLLTGEDILGDVVEVDNNTVKVKDAVRVMVFPNKNDEATPGVAFVPFSHWTKDTELELNRHHVLALMNPISEFVEQYTATFSGLIVPDTKIITP